MPRQRGHRTPRSGCRSSGLGEPDISRNLGAVHLPTEILHGLLCNLPGEIQALVVHREQYAFDLERGIQTLLDQSYRVQKLAKSFQRIEFALDRDQHRIGGRQGIQREEAQGGRTIDENEVVLVSHLLQGPAQDRLSLAFSHELDLGSDQISRGGEEIQLIEMHALGHTFRNGTPLYEYIVDRRARRAPLEPEPGRCVALGVDIDDQRALLGNSERRTEIDGRRRLADSALLVCDGNDARHGGRLGRDGAGRKDGDGIAI